MRELLIPILFIGFLTANFSCQKEPVIKTNTDLLTQASWKTITVETDAGTGTYAVDPMEDCEKDDITKFNTDFTVTNRAGVKCDPSEEDDSAKWAFSADEKTITITASTGTSSLAIEMLDENNLVFTIPYTFGSIEYRQRRTFIH